MYQLLSRTAIIRIKAHLSPEDRVNVNYDHPLAFDTELLISHLEKLLAGTSCRKATV